MTSSDHGEFAARAAGWLTRKPIENNVLLVHALDPAGVPPGEGEPVFAWIADPPAEVLGAAFTRAPYRMTISGMPAAAASALAEHLFKLELRPPGVNGPAAAAAAFAGRWSELTGRPAHPEREQWLMSCTDTERPASRPGRPRPAAADDLDMVAEWFAASMRDSGLAEEDILRRSRHLVQGQIAGHRLIVWVAEDGAAVGAAGWAPPIAGVVRPSGVFVSPERRNGGYATLLLGEVTARALEDGADACVCTHYLKYESMLPVVEKAGYRRLLDLTEYRFD